MKMNVEVKTELVKRLRSGNYRQGNNYLNKAGKFCCLGVLCEIAVENGICERKIDDDYFSNGATYIDDTTSQYGASGVPSRKVTCWAFNEIFIPKDKLGQSLVTMNDTLKWSFEQIADFIEESL